MKIAVQMDPIQRINIKGDSTFSLLLEAQKRSHALSYYTTDRLHDSAAVIHEILGAAAILIALTHWLRRGTRR